MDFFLERIGKTYDELFDIGPVRSEALFSEQQNQVFSGFKWINRMNFSTAYGHIKKKML